LGSETRETMDNLTEILEAQSDIYRALVELAAKKRQVLVDGSLEGLNAVVRAEQALLWRAGRFEERRAALQERLASELGVAPGEMTLQTLVDHLQDKDAARCRRLSRQLRESVDQLQQVNQVNRELITQSLAYVNLSLRLLARAEGGSPTYEVSGRTRESARRIAVDKQA